MSWAMEIILSATMAGLMACAIRVCHQLQRIARALEARPVLDIMIQEQAARARDAPGGDCG